METTTTTRVDQFKSDISDMKLKTGTSSTEGALQILGAVLMIAGIAISIGAYISSTGADIPADQTELLSLGLAGVCVTLTGVGLFVRYSLAKFFRFWLLRQMYEGQSHIDQVVDALRER
jgi:membrane-bound ClpP family serine protease